MKPLEAACITSSLKLSVPKEIQLEGENTQYIVTNGDVWLTSE